MSRFMEVYESSQSNTNDNVIIRVLKTVWNAIKKAVDYVVTFIRKIIRKFINYIKGIDEHNFGAFKIGDLTFDYSGDAREPISFISKIQIEFLSIFGKYGFTERDIDPTSNIAECETFTEQLQTSLDQFMHRKDAGGIIYEALGTDQFINTIRSMESSITDYIGQVKSKFNTIYAKMRTDKLGERRNSEWTRAIQVMCGKYSSVITMVLKLVTTDMSTMYLAHECAVKYFRENGEIPTTGYFDSKGYFDGKTHHKIDK